MKPTNVYITDRQKEFLKETAEELQIKPAELLRRVLDQYITQTEEDKLRKKMIEEK